MGKLPHIILSKKLKALQDPTRLKILSLLSKRPLCVCVITEALRLAQPTISRHLALLENAGFIQKERQGRMIIYAISPEDELARRLLDVTLEETAKDPECAALLNYVEDETGGTLALLRRQEDPLSPREKKQEMI